MRGGRWPVHVVLGSKASVAKRSGGTTPGWRGPSGGVARRSGGTTPGWRGPSGRRGEEFSGGTSGERRVVCDAGAGGRVLRSVAAAEHGAEYVRCRRAEEQGEEGQKSREQSCTTPERHCPGVVHGEPGSQAFCQLLDLGRADLGHVWLSAQALQPLVQAGEELGMSHFLDALDGRAQIRRDEHSFLEQMQMQKATGEWVSLFMLATNMSRSSAPADSVARILIETGADVNRPQQKEQGDGMPTVFLEACYLNRLHLSDLMLRHGADASAHTPKGNWVATLPFKHHNTITTQFAKDLLLRNAASERGEEPTSNDWMRNLKTLPRFSEWAARSPKFTDLVVAAGQGRSRVSADRVGRAVVRRTSLSMVVLRACMQLSAGCWPATDAATTGGVLQAVRPGKL